MRKTRNGAGQPVPFHFLWVLKGIIMKRIFLIGDSIRIGYDSVVRDALASSAQIYWDADNARFVQYTLRNVAVWAQHDCDPEKIDIVYWNNGLWDVAHMKDGNPLNSIETYTETLKRILSVLHCIFPHAQIIFAQTTCVLEERINPDIPRCNADICAYNQAAVSLMEASGIPAHDLYSVSRAVPDEQRTEDGVHFTPAGYQALGLAVANYLRAFLD